MIGCPDAIEMARFGFDPKAFALQAASRAGQPFACACGSTVVLVLSVAEGRAQQWECSSASLAKAVAARAVTDLRLFPWLGDRILKTSEMYALAARRVAARRLGRLWEGVAL